MAKKNEIIILDFKVNTDDIKAKLGVVVDEITRLKIANQELRKAQKDAINEGQAAQAARLAEKIGANEAVLKSLGREYRNYTGTLDRVQRFKDAEEGSYERLLQEYELAAVQLKLLGDQQQRAADGSVVLTKEYQEQAAKVKQLKDGVDSFNKGIGDGRSSVGQYAEAIKEAFGDTGLFGKELGTISAALKAGKGAAGLFANGIKGIGLAIQTSGIGIFTGAFQLLQSLITKNDSVLDRYEQGVAALGQVFKAVVGVVLSFGRAIVDAVSQPQKVLEFLVDYINETVIQQLKGAGEVIAGIFTLDFDRVSSGAIQFGQGLRNISKPAEDAADAIGEFGKSTFEAAQAAVELTKRTQELDDRERAFKTTAEATKLEVDNLIKQARERTGVEEERLQLLDRAAELEKSALKEAQAIAEERVAIGKAENELLAKKKQLTDAERDAQVERENELIRIKGESAIKQSDIENRKAIIISQINQKEIQVRIDALNAQVTAAELAGKRTIELQKRLAEEERKIRLEEIGLSNAQRETIQLEYETKLLAIQKKAEADRKNIIQQAEDVRLSLIKDSYDRELQQVIIEFNRKMDLIKGNTQEEIRLREQLELQLGDRIAGIEEKRFNDGAEKRRQNIEKNASEEIQTLQSAALEAERAVQLSLLRREITEQEAAKAINEIKLGAAIDELNVIRDTEAQKAIDVEKGYALQKEAIQKSYEDGKLSKKAYDAALLKLDEEYIVQKEILTRTSQEAVVEAERAYYETRNQIAFDSNSALIEDEQRLLEARREINGKALDALSANLSAAAGFLTADEKRKKKYADTLKALAIADVSINSIKEISGYWAGVGKDASTTGNIIGASVSTALAIALTAASVVRAAAAISQITSTKTFAWGGYTGAGTTRDSTGHKVAGVVHNDEWVAPKWMVTNPQFSPVIQQLEEVRRSGKKFGYADGGFTSQFIAAKGLVQGERSDLTEQMIDVIKKVQIVAVAEEITESQTIVSTIQTNAEI